MLIDARTVAHNTVVETDVCIIGAGVAGITLARDALGQQGLRLDWQLTAEEKRSMLRAHEIIGAEIGRAGLGRQGSHHSAKT